MSFDKPFGGLRDMVFSEYKKQCILHYYFAGDKSLTIREENLHCTQKGVHGFLRRYEIMGDVRRKSGSGRHTDEVKAFVEEQIQCIYNV